MADFVVTGYLRSSLFWIMNGSIKTTSRLSFCPIPYVGRRVKTLT